MPRQKVKQRLAAQVAAVAGGFLLVLAGCSPKDGEPDFPPTTPFEPGALEELHEIRDRVAKLRDLPVNPDVTEGWLSSADYREYVEEMFSELDDETMEQVEAGDTALKLLGVLAPDESYYEQALDLESNYVAGFYDSDLDELVLVGGDGSISPFDHSTLAHEYVHSFQDALTEEEDWRGRFDELMEDDENPLDYAYTLGCILEGDAEFSQSMFDGEELEGWEWYVEMLTWMERNMYFPYAVCPEFVSYVYADGGWDAVNELYERPPVSLEQVMHPRKYLRDERPAGLAPLDLSGELGDGWERVTNGIFNEFDLWNYVLELTGDIDEADEAAAGWGMGWVGIYQGGAEEAGEAHVVLHISLAFDSLGDYLEFQSAFAKVVRTLGGTGIRGWTTGPGEGLALWDEEHRRVDLVAATDGDLLSRAAAAVEGDRSRVAAERR